MNNKQAGLLGIARRAGHILIGFDAVRAALLAGHAQLVWLASDCSPKTEKELRFAGRDTSCPILSAQATKEELAQALGLMKPVAVVATDDRGFATAMRKHSTQTKEDVAL